METFDPYYRWLGIHPDEQPPNHYRLLGLRLFEDDSDVIAAAADRQMAFVQQCANGPHVDESQRLLNELSNARVCLLDEGRRAAYNAELRQKVVWRKWVLPVSGCVAAGVILLVLWSLVGSGPTQTKATVDTQTAEKPRPEIKVIPPEPFDGTQPRSADEVRAAQTAWAGFLKKSVNETNSIGMELVLIPPGKFQMGSLPTDANAQPNEKPQRRVKITNPFYIGMTEVTQKQWQTVMGTTPWKGREFAKEGADYPATYISWDDAQEFCEKLGKKEHATYQLPTEAEWEHACRAGQTTRFSFGDNESNLNDYGWWGGIKGDGNAKSEPYAHAVGMKKANPFGMFDMHGNVWEWCEDLYADKVPGGTDPLTTSGHTHRAIRGGSWHGPFGDCRSAFRGANLPADPSFTLGLRVARNESAVKSDLVRTTKPPDAEKKGITVTESPETITIVVTATIDGQDEFRIYTDAVAWGHGSFNWPANVKINTFAWTPQKEPRILNVEKKLWNAGKDMFSPGRPSFGEASLTVHHARGQITFHRSEDHVRVHIHDGDLGADVYELVVKIPKLAEP